MKIKKIEKLSTEQKKQYSTQTVTTRNRESKGGYDTIVIATDQDLD